MIVRDFEHTQEINTDKELEEFLMRRQEKDGARVNSFWMCHAKEVPVMAMLVRDNLACLDYMADSEGTAFASHGDLVTLVKDATTLFWLDDQRQPVRNDHIINFAEAVRAAKEFLHVCDLPKSVKWISL